VTVLVRSCSSKFFHVSLPGSTLLILDLIHAANVVLSLPHDYQDFNRHPVTHTYTSFYLLFALSAYVYL